MHHILAPWRFEDKFSICNYQIKTQNKTKKHNLKRILHGQRNKTLCVVADFVVGLKCTIFWLNGDLMVLMALSPEMVHFTQITNSATSLKVL